MLSYVTIQQAMSLSNTAHHIIITVFSCITSTTTIITIHTITVQDGITTGTGAQSDHIAVVGLIPELKGRISLTVTHHTTGRGLLNQTVETTVVITDTLAGQVEADQVVVAITVAAAVEDQVHQEEDNKGLKTHDKQ